MNESELRTAIEKITAKKHGSSRINPFDILKTIHRKKFPASSLPLLEPLLQHDSYYKYAIDIVGNMKGASTEASNAVEAAWERSWVHGVPQACPEVFQALLKIGGNDNRLLIMIGKSLEVDNYASHRVCADTLMKIPGGRSILKNWCDTIAGKCDCHLHRKLTEKITRHLETE